MRKRENQSAERKSGTSAEAVKREEPLMEGLLQHMRERDTGDDRHMLNDIVVFFCCRRRAADEFLIISIAA